MTNNEIKECSICSSTETKKCKCGGYYCEIHMKFHKENFCKFGKKGSKILAKENLEKEDKKK